MLIRIRLDGFHRAIRLEEAQIPTQTHSARNRTRQYTRLSYKTKSRPAAARQPDPATAQGTAHPPLPFPSLKVTKACLLRANLLSEAVVAAEWHPYVNNERAMMLTRPSIYLAQNSHTIAPNERPFCRDTILLSFPKVLWRWPGIT